MIAITSQLLESINIVCFYTLVAVIRSFRSFIRSFGWLASQFGISLQPHHCCFSSLDFDLRRREKISIKLVSVPNRTTENEQHMIILVHCHGIGSHSHALAFALLFPSFSRARSRYRFRHSLSFGTWHPKKSFVFLFGFSASASLFISFSICNDVVFYESSLNMSQIHIAIFILLDVVLTFTHPHMKPFQFVCRL